MDAFFTGHRRIYANTELSVKALIDQAFEKGASHFYCGMALGYDQMVARILSECCLSWDAVIPFLGQENKWRREDRIMYHELLKSARKVIILNKEGEYSPDLFHARNRWMIKKSGLCVAVFNGKESGGTYETLRKAKGKMPILMLKVPEKSLVFERISEQLTLF